MILHFICPYTAYIYSNFFSFAVIDVTIALLIVVVLTERKKFMACTLELHINKKGTVCGQHEQGLARFASHFINYSDDEMVIREDS